MKLTDLQEAQFTFDLPRRPLNVPNLIKSGAIYITQPHGEKGWEPEGYGFSLITLYNIHGGGWPKEAKQHLKPEAYKEAAKLINAPVKGSNHLVYDNKYQQILWSIKKLGLSPKQAFLK